MAVQYANGSNVSVEFSDAFAVSGSNDSWAMNATNVSSNFTTMLGLSASTVTTTFVLRWEGNGTRESKITSGDSEGLLVNSSNGSRGTGDMSNLSAELDVGNSTATTAVVAVQYANGGNVSVDSSDAFAMNGSNDSWAMNATNVSPKFTAMLGLSASTLTTTSVLHLVGNRTSENSITPIDSEEQLLNGSNGSSSTGDMSNSSAELGVGSSTATTTVIAIQYANGSNVSAEYSDAFAVSGSNDSWAMNATDVSPNFTTMLGLSASTVTTTAVLRWEGNGTRESKITSGDSEGLLVNGSNGSSGTGDVSNLSAELGVGNSTPNTTVVAVEHANGGNVSADSSDAFAMNGSNDSWAMNATNVSPKFTAMLGLSASTLTTTFVLRLVGNGTSENSITSIDSDDELLNGSNGSSSSSSS
eukprot:TRINITY_DN6797_c0_g1_i4.p1 TRINITY_DN6797_c0_g1~~TRINITY_DN6797_c0_g1_i4.p1  ORF type:complete len:415 (+),score=70.73 TRINITY_DN6797_c0_g1_i4:1-1245(+)